jgi:hypothetical protein
MEIFVDVIKWYSLVVLSIIEISLALRIAASKDWNEGIQTIISFILFSPILLLVVYMLTI